MEFFNLYLISGYCIQKLYPPFSEHDVTNGQAHVLILGAGRMGEEIDYPNGKAVDCKKDRY